MVLVAALQVDFAPQATPHVSTTTVITIPLENILSLAFTIEIAVRTQGLVVQDVAPSQDRVQHHSALAQIHMLITV